MSDADDLLREARGGMSASSPRAQARPQSVTEPPIVLLSEADKIRIAEAWWAGNLNVGDRVELESGHGVTCCAVEVGGGEPPHLTFRADPDASSVRVSFVIDGLPE